MAENSKSIPKARIDGGNIEHIDWDTVDLGASLLYACNKEGWVKEKFIRKVLEKEASSPDYFDESSKQTPLLAMLKNLSSQQVDKNKKKLYQGNYKILTKENDQGAPSLIEQLVSGTTKHIDHADSEGKTALYYAIQLAKNAASEQEKEIYKGIIKSLIEKGAKKDNPKVEELLSGEGYADLKAYVDTLNSAQGSGNLDPEPNPEPEPEPVPDNPQAETLEQKKAALKKLWLEYLADPVKFKGNKAKMDEKNKLESDIAAAVEGGGKQVLNDMWIETSREYASQIAKQQQEALLKDQQVKLAQAYNQGLAEGQKQGGGKGGKTPDGGKTGTDTTNLPPEAVVQQPEPESFWNWKNILWMVGILATLGLSLWFIKKEKDKAKDAKKETAALQSEVNSLQNQLDDLTKDTAVLSPVDTHDGTTLASSGVRYTDTVLNVSNRIGKSNG